MRTVHVIDSTADAFDEHALVSVNDLGSPVGHGRSVPSRSPGDDCTGGPAERSSVSVNDRDRTHFLSAPSNWALKLDNTIDEISLAIILSPVDTSPRAVSAAQFTDGHHSC